MFRLLTKVTSSPTISERSWSATVGDRPDLGPPGGEQGDDLVLAHRLAVEHAGQYLAHRTPGRGQRERRETRPGRPVPPAPVGRMRRRCRAAPVAARRRPMHQGWSRPSPSASEASSTGKRRAGSSHRSGSRANSGYRVRRGARVTARGLGGLPQDAQVGPRPFGVDVVGGDRGDAAPVVDAGRQQRSQVVGEVGRGLQVDLGGEDQSGRGDGPEELVGRAGRPLVHGGARLGQEVLDDHLLHVAVASVAGGDGLEGGQPVGPGLADAHQQPGGEGDAGLAGGLEGGQPAAPASCPGPSGGRPGRG